MSDIRLNIDGLEVTCAAGKSILDAARENGIEIETLCHDERVKAYGSCGLCVVEAEGSPKLLRACSTEAQNGMIIRTDGERARASRKTALELLLSDHTGDCRPPCTLACPGETDCQGYVGLIANGMFAEAAKLIKEQLPLPASIGRVCPHPCETACRRKLAEEPVNISMLKSAAADYGLEEGAFIPAVKPPRGKKAAVVGGGPGGLTAAYFLRKEGVDVTVYDMMPQMGGMLRYGIPEYRLPKSVLDKEIAVFEKMGVKLVNGVKVGRDISLRSLVGGSDAVMLAPGAWASMTMGVKGEGIPGVIGGIDFLRKAALGEHAGTGKRVAVVGGGNTAMDAARTAVRLGAEEVYVIYRRTMAEMPAEEAEIAEAGEEGVIFKFLSNPLEFSAGGDGKLESVRIQKMRLGEPDASGRRSPVPIEGEEERLGIDTLIMAIGQTVDPAGLEGVALTKRGTVAADENAFTTNIEGVFAFGDATNKGASIAIEAIGEAKKAAGAVLSYFDGKLAPYKKPYVSERRDLTAADFADREKAGRVKVRHAPADERKRGFGGVTYIYSREEAMKEAARCLECGCHDFFECRLISYANRYDVRPERLGGERHVRKEQSAHPFITRDADKCVLCGLCVRVCDEVMGIGAFGLVNRGFDTVVRPAMDMPLEQAGCIACGQCVSLCPTGALGEKLPLAKNVPLKQDATRTVCSFCGVGCKTDIWSKGGALLRSTFENTDKEKGCLCVNGRFGFAEAQKNRLAKPLVKRNGRFEETELDAALSLIHKKIREISLRHGADSIAVSVSDRLTSEEIFLVREYAEKAIGTKNAVCFNSDASGLGAVLGSDISTCAFEELDGAEVIFLAYSDIMKNHAVAGIKIKRAVENGAKLIVLNDGPTLADEWAQVREHSGNSTESLGAFAKCLIGLGAKPARANGFEAFARSVSALPPSGAVKQMAEIYYKAKTAVIICEDYRLSPAASALLAEAAVISGHIARPRNGIINLLKNCNGAGARALGVGIADGRAADIEKAVAEGRIKALVCFGEDIPHVDTDKLELLAVFDTHMSETAERADIAMPINSFAETSGGFISADRKIQEVRKAIEPLTGMENWEIIARLSAMDGAAMPGGIGDVRERMLAALPEMKGHNGPALYCPGGSPVMYRGGFATESGLAEFVPYKNTAAVRGFVNTNGVYNRFLARLRGV